MNNNNNPKWYTTTILMPDDQLYVGITEGDYGTDITISEHYTQEQAELACEQYSRDHKISMFGEYRQEVNN